MNNSILGSLNTGKISSNVENQISKVVKPYRSKGVKHTKKQNFKMFFLYLLSSISLFTFTISTYQATLPENYLRNISNKDSTALNIERVAKKTGDFKKKKDNFYLTKKEVVFNALNVYNLNDDQIEQLLTNKTVMNVNNTGRNIEFNFESNQDFFKKGKTVVDEKQAKIYDLNYKLAVSRASKEKIMNLVPYFLVSTLSLTIAMIAPFYDAKKYSKVGKELI